jgi:hypothetical protein
MKRNRHILRVLFGCIAALSLPVQAQIYNQNIIGYYNLVLHAGDNFIANQFSNGSNTLNEIFFAPVNPAIPDGATFTKWNANTLQFLPLSTYNHSTGWSINYSLTFGEGGKLAAPAGFTNTFVGFLDLASLVFSNSDVVIVPPLVTDTGLLLLSDTVPLQNAGFHDVVGRDPLPGEYVKLFNALSQTETITTFNGFAWDNGTPALQIGQSAFFGLAAVPEPSTFILSASSLAPLVLLRGKFRNRK